MSPCSLQTFSEIIIPQFLFLKFKKVRNSKPPWEQCSDYPVDFSKEALSSGQRCQGVRCPENPDYPGNAAVRGADSSGNWLLLLTKQQRKHPRLLFQHLAEMKVKYKVRKPKKPTQPKPLFYLNLRVEHIIAFSAYKKKVSFNQSKLLFFSMKIPF